MSYYFASVIFAVFSLVSGNLLALGAGLLFAVLGTIKEKR